VLACNIGNLICNTLGPSFDRIVSILGNQSTIVELHKVKRGIPFEREWVYRILVERVLKNVKVLKLEEVFYKG